MDVLPIWHFVFIACCFFLFFIFMKRHNSTFGINNACVECEKTQDGNLDVGTDSGIGCLLLLVN